MFLGTYQGVLSPKHRVAIPKKFLSQLSETIILAKWYEGCLVLISDTGWDALLKRLRGSTEIATRPIRDTDRFILGSAFDLIPDEQGRVVIPQPLVRHAGLGPTIVFIGLGEKVEIWDEAKWQEKEKDVSEHAAELIEEIANERR